MSPDEELQTLRQENAELRANLAEVSKALLQKIQRVKKLEERLMKYCHNSHLPPSSDRFARQKKTRSLRKRIATSDQWELIANVTFHDLRHDFAHRARDAGWSLEELAYYLGHVTVK